MALGSGIRDPGSRKNLFRIPESKSTRSRIPDPDPQHCPVLKNMKILGFFYFCGSFLPSWIQIRIRNLNADPDPATQINADPDADPDPKPCQDKHT